MEIKTAPQSSGSKPSQSKRQTRRDCRKEAAALGLRGKEKRKFRRDCRKAGGVDDGAENFSFDGTNPYLEGVM